MIFHRLLSLFESNFSWRVDCKILRRSIVANNENDDDDEFGSSLTTILCCPLNQQRRRTTLIPMNAPIFFNVNRRWLFLFLETFKFQIESEGVGGWVSSD